MSPQTIQFENLMVMPTLVSIFIAFFTLFLILLFYKDKKDNPIQNRLIMITAAPFIFFIAMWIYFGVKPGDISVIQQNGNMYTAKHELRPWFSKSFDREQVARVDFHFKTLPQRPQNRLQFYGKINFKDNSTLQTISLITLDEQDKERGFAYCKLMFSALGLLESSNDPHPPLQYLLTKYNKLTSMYSTGLLFFFLLSVIQFIFVPAKKGTSILLNSQPKGTIFEEKFRIPYAKVEEEPVESLRTQRHVGNKIIDSITINGEKIVITIEKVRNKTYIFCNDKQYRMVEEIENPHVRQRVKGLLRNTGEK